MNYYPHHIGDYTKDTAHLTMLEDAAYRRMLDVYYSSEKPLPALQASIYRLVRARSHAEKLAVDVILGEFFIESPEGWRNKRADVEIAKAQEKAEKAKASADARWGKCERNANASPNAMRKHSEGNAPNNQEPRTRVGRGTRLPPDWTPDEQLRLWAVGARPDVDIPAAIEKFRDYWHSLPGARGVKLDWGKTFRNWVREEKPTRPSGAPTASTAVQSALGNCPCGAAATVKVGGKPRCNAHVRGDLPVEKAA